MKSKSIICKMTLKKLLLTTILSLSIIPVFILGFTSAKVTNDGANKDFSNNGKLLVDIANDMIATRFKSYKGILDGLASQSDFNDVNNLKNNLLLTAKNDSSILNAYYAPGNDAKLIQSLDGELPADFDAREQQWYADSLAAKGGFTFEQPYKDTLTDKYTVTIYKGVIKDNNEIGVLALDIDLTSLSEQISCIQYGKTGKIIVTSKDGLVIAHTDKNKIGTDEPAKLPVWKEISSKTDGYLNYNFNKVFYNGYYTTDNYTGYKIILTVTKNEILNTVLSQLISLVIILVIIIVICIFASLKLSRFLVNNIHAIQSSLSKASSGDFTEELTFEKRTEEFTDLENSYNEMSTNLKDLISNVTSSTNDVTKTSNLSLNTSKDIAGTIEQVATTITQISVGTSESANGLEDISNNMNTLSESLNEITELTNTANKMAESTNELGKEGLQLVEDIKSKSDVTKNSTTEVYNVVSDVSYSIEKIQNINKAISDITEQTNLLALNAAIEAARAGEAGRGFAVVSDQIRKLAEETSQSAKQIDAIITEINTNAEQAVNKAKLTTDAVKSQEDVVNHSQEIFTKIINELDEVTSKIYEISRSTESVNKMKDNVSHQVDSLSSILEETAAGTEEVTASAEEVSAATQEFVVNFSKLKEMADDLNNQIDHFKS